MFSICPKKVYQNKGLTALDIRVYLAIQGFANDDGYCFPSVAKIADICGITRRAVFYSLAKLETCKIIAREKRLRDDGGYSSNGYYLKLKPGDDVNNSSLGGVNDGSLGSEQQFTSNKNRLNNIVNLKFTNSARVGARENGNIITTDDVARVAACRLSVVGAAKYQFFKSNGTICVRPYSALFYDAIAESQIVSFFENFNEKVRVCDWNIRSSDEQDILTGEKN